MGEGSGSDATRPASCEARAMSGTDAATVILRTPRLVLRELVVDDATFLVDLLNDADFMRHIGDRGVRTREDAERYLAEGPLASYARHGFGLWHVARAGDRVAIGICGLLRRDTLDDVDIGFAFLPAFRGSGYARESAAAVIAHAHHAIGLERVVAIVAPANAASARLLERIGMRYDRLFRHTDGGEALHLFVWRA